MKNTILTALTAFLIFMVGCKQKERQVANEQVMVEALDTEELDAIFPKGQKGPADFFTGNAYNYGLVPMDSTYTTLVGNVYFEPGARSNWHDHPAGQILIITDGEGFHQIEGQPKEKLTKGSIVKCPPNAKHWHGASPEKGMQQIYIVPNTEKGVVNWMEPVSDEQYNGN
ncbi:MAG: cupin domain-containing protein [Bacteroidota bacterium]|uniref:Cupin domain-containing protein n=1 Tax=Flagellimonas profundi TaxID=2915620 RepID=A0ABS3FCS2_9FLAO|nr:cupin domain-containing protein [Allomuricauda profundi]MBO0340376.1 cupin domain-containing protein [Allomuricauda profundi]MEC7770328.1 cupin domain-containing protein [Bacteroidota bacterium]